MQPEPSMACTVRESLRLTTLPRLELQMLLGHAMSRSRAWLIAHDDEVLSADCHASFLQLCARRESGEPMAYLLGYREFMALEFEVSPAVLIPRPETELLVYEVLAMIGPIDHPRILDLGTGSGAIAVSLAHARRDASVWATDISADALAVACRNAANHGVDVQFLQGSWFEALNAGVVVDGFDVIVSNPPYIAQNDQHLRQGDLRYEPSIALTDQADGLSAYRAMVMGAPRYLGQGGSLVVEHGFDQGALVSELFKAAGFDHIKTLPDLAGHPRVTTGSYNG